MGTAFIVIILISLFFFGLTFGQWISMFNLTGSNKFHFLSYFPFELNGFRRKTKQGKISIFSGFIPSIIPIKICPNSCKKQNIIIIKYIFN